MLITNADSWAGAPNPEGPGPCIPIRPPQQLPPSPEAWALPWGLPGCGQHEGLWSLQNITNELLRIEPEKARSTAECEVFLQALPGSGSAPLLRTRVEDTNRRYERLVQLLDSAQEK